MDNQERQSALNAVKILSLAAESYFQHMDELGKSFVGPNVSAALKLFGDLVDEHFPATQIEPAEAAPPKKSKNQPA